MRVNLYFRTFPDFDLLERKILAETIRLLGEIQLKTKENWTKSYTAIIDTGAPFSLFPLEIWQAVETEILTDTVVKGLIPKEQCVLPVKVGKITLRLIDREEHISKPLTIMAYLAPNNKIPLIIGFQDILSELRVHFSYKERIAYIEEIE
ncbi:MAG: hypothetical protein E3J87_08440 [Candidatus Cloacimonadota bacterium]|nr:MAG: hypothetical protein E3J87_08440 [Candidatus Cloacimonadota bacterium]